MSPRVVVDDVDAGALMVPPEWNVQTDPDVLPIDTDEREPRAAATSQPRWSGSPRSAQLTD